MHINNKNKKPRIVLISLFSIDLGLRYISSFLNSKGYLTDIISFGQLRITYELPCNNYILRKFLQHNPCPDRDAKLLLNLLFDLKPDLIGISLSSTSFITASFLTQKIKERFKIPIVWGGIHPTLCPEDCIQHADIVCVGEGEYPMYELAQKLKNSEEVTAIKNLWIKHKDGSIEKNELRDLILDLDSLPYPDFVRFGNKFLIDRGMLIRDPILVSSYLNRGYTISSTRGCHFNCSFCCNSVLRVIYKDKGPYLRRRTPENVIDELVHVRKNREIVQIRFWDDIFTYDQEWIEQFHQLYIKKVSVPFTCYAHPRYTNKKIIQMLAKAGLISVDVGIQSGSDSFCRERFKREQSNEEIIEFANSLSKLKVIPRYNVIVDNPYENDADSDATAELLMRLPQPYIAELYSLCYFPKAELTNQALKDGLITEEEIEGRINKALNNFYMFIDLAKDKKRFFWDTIIAMAVSDFFSEGLIRRCKRNRFMRNHPRLLLVLVRLYLRISLLSPLPLIDIVLKNLKIVNKSQREHRVRHRLLFKKNPRLFLSLAKLYLKLGEFWKDKSKFFVYCNSLVNDCHYHIIDTFDYPLEENTKVDLLIFPKESTQDMNKSFYLEIKMKEPSRSFSSLNLLIQIFPSTMNRLEKKRVFCQIDFEITNDHEEVEIGLSFPNLFIKSDNIYREIKIRDIKNLLEDTSFNVSLFLYDEIQKNYISKNSIIIHNEQ